MFNRMTFLAVLMFALASSAGAQKAAEETAPQVWTVADREVLRIRVTIGDMTPFKRVDLFEGRLTEILSRVERPIGVGDIELKMVGKCAAITVCGDLLVTVMPEDAAANKTTVEKLGRIWLSNLRKAVPLLSPRVNPRGV